MCDNFDKYYLTDSVKRKEVKQFYKNHFTFLNSKNEMHGEMIYSIKSLCNKMIKELELKSDQQIDIDQIINKCNNLCTKYMSAIELEKNKNAVDQNVNDFYSEFIESKLNKNEANNIALIVCEDKVKRQLKECFAYYIFIVWRFGNFMPLPLEQIKSSGGARMNSWKGSGYDDPIQFYNVTFREYINNNEDKSNEMKLFYKVEDYEAFLEANYLNELDFNIDISSCELEDDFIQYILNAIEFITNRHNSLSQMKY